MGVAVAGLHKTYVAAEGWGFEIQCARLPGQFVEITLGRGYRIVLCAQKQGGDRQRTYEMDSRGLVVEVIGIAVAVDGGEIAILSLPAQVRYFPAHWHT
jgi:hypothetical protein